MADSTQKFKRKAAWLPIIFFLGGMGLAYLGWKGSIPLLIFGGLLPIAGAVVLFGIDAVRTRRSSYTGGEYESEFHYTYRGLAAIMDGLVLILLGAAILAVSLAGLLGLGDAALDYFSIHPGLPLIFSGALLAAYSYTLIAGPQGDNRGSWRLLASLPGRVLGLTLFLIAGGMIVLGAYELILPGGFDRLIEGFRSSLRPNS